MHPFHLVSSSPWPILCSFGLLNLTFSSADWMWGGSFLWVFLSISSISLISFLWWRDVVRESLLEGFHTLEVKKGLQLGMILFITSEVFFFLSFFWSFFHSSLSPDIFIGSEWPCKGIQSFSPMGIPLLNTIILLSSGVTVTWCHHSLFKGNLSNSLISLFLTCFLGIYFTFLQTVEYKMSSFSISDSVYGSTFFSATGFHGLHVLIGTTFLFICFLRLQKNHFSSNHFLGFESAAWYWHFVDVVWLFLYIFLYFWFE